MKWLLFSVAAMFAWTAAEVVQADRQADQARRGKALEVALAAAQDRLDRARPGQVVEESDAGEYRVDGSAGDGTRYSVRLQSTTDGQRWRIVSVRTYSAGRR